MHGFRWGIELAGQAIDVFSTRDLVLVLPTEESVSDFVPDDELIAQMRDYHALIVTAQSGVQGYVLRYFAPKIGIPEDRATGSAHCSLAPYWFDQLNTETLVARQLSSSGGHFIIEKESNALINILAQVSPRETAI